MDLAYWSDFVLLALVVVATGVLVGIATDNKWIGATVILVLVYLWVTA